MKKEELSYEVIKCLGELSESKSGWKTEANVMSWNGKPAVIDIRAWSPDKAKMGKGITLTDDEQQKLYKILESHLSEKPL